MLSLGQVLWCLRFDSYCKHMTTLRVGDIWWVRPSVIIRIIAIGESGLIAIEALDDRDGTVITTTVPAEYLTNDKRE